MYIKDDEVLYGYAMLPCFKIEIRKGIAELVCSDTLAKIFEIFFAPFWSGKVHLYPPVNEEK